MRECKLEGLPKDGVRPVVRVSAGISDYKVDRENVTRRRRCGRDPFEAELPAMFSHNGEDRPMAVAGLISYRYRGNYSWIMIGAESDVDALRSAKQSLSYGEAALDKLQRWNGVRYEWVFEG